MTINPRGIGSIPENNNNLQPNKFTFLFPTLPFLKYFSQTAILPGVSTSAVSVETPFSNTFRHGDKLVYEPLSFTTIIDEDLRVWEETYNWLVALTFPKKFPQYIRNLEGGRGTPYHDGLLTINDNAHLPRIRIKYLNVHPVSIGAVNFTVSESADVTITTDIQFQYDRFEIER